MGKLLKRYLLAFLIAGVGVALADVMVAQAAKTKFTNVEVTGSLDVDGAMTTGSCTCTNISTSAFSAASVSATYGVTSATNSVTGTSTLNNVTVSTVTWSGAQGLIMAPAHITAASTTPTATGVLGTDSSWILYISTSTSPGGWKKISAQ